MQEYSDSDEVDEEALLEMYLGEGSFFCEGSWLMVQQCVGMAASRRREMCPARQVSCIMVDVDEQGRWPRFLRLHSASTL